MGYDSVFQDSKDAHAAAGAGWLAGAGAPALDSDELSPQMEFADAFERWIAQKTIVHGLGRAGPRYLSERTLRDLRQYARAAGGFFGALKLGEIHAGHLREYQRARANCDAQCGQWKRPAGANLIRKEVGTVVRVMRAAGAWGAHHERCFEALPAQEADVPRAISPEEQQRWLATAASRPEWAVVHWWSIVGLQTAAATNELRALRLGDLFLEQGVLQVRAEGAKNHYRVRTVPLEGDGLRWALERLEQRAWELGARLPQHYLFPRHITAQRYDAARPMTVWGLRRPWDEVRAAAGMPAFTPYALRHTGATRMAESGMPIQVLMSMMGHVSPRMQQHYIVVSMQAKRRWARIAWDGAGKMEAAEMGASKLGPRAEVGCEEHRARQG